jgi:hypothetical protein
LVAIRSLLLVDHCGSEGAEYLYYDAGKAEAAVLARRDLPRIDLTA